MVAMDMAEEIVAQLDEAVPEYRFADPGHPYYSAIDARLHLYHDRTR